MLLQSLPEVPEAMQSTILLSSFSLSLPPVKHVKQYINYLTTYVSTAFCAFSQNESNVTRQIHTAGIKIPSH